MFTDMFTGNFKYIVKVVYMWRHVEENNCGNVKGYLKGGVREDVKVDI